jgi:hypothetical protein
MYGHERRTKELEAVEMPLDYGMAAVLYLLSCEDQELGPCSFPQPAD